MNQSDINRDISVWEEIFTIFKFFLCAIHADFDLRSICKESKEFLLDELFLAVLRLNKAGSYA